MANIGEIDIGIDWDCCSKTCCCGSLGFARQHISGDGTFFLNAGGTVMKKDLLTGETVIATAVAPSPALTQWSC